MNGHTAGSQIEQQFHGIRVAVFRGDHERRAAVLHADGDGDDLANPMVATATAAVISPVKVSFFVSFICFVAFRG